jgi:hypothetical protein
MQTDAMVPDPDSESEVLREVQLERHRQAVVAAEDDVESMLGVTPAQMHAAYADPVFRTKLLNFARLAYDCVATHRGTIVEPAFALPSSQIEQDQLFVDMAKYVTQNANDEWGEISLFKQPVAGCLYEYQHDGKIYLGKTCATMDPEKTTLPVATRNAYGLFRPQQDNSGGRRDFIKDLNAVVEAAEHTRFLGHRQRSTTFFDKLLNNPQRLVTRTAIRGHPLSTFPLLGLACRWLVHEAESREIVSRSLTDPNIGLNRSENGDINTTGVASKGVLIEGIITQTNRFARAAGLQELSSAKLKELKKTWPLLSDLHAKMVAEGLFAAEADPDNLKYVDNFGRMRMRKQTRQGYKNRENVWSNACKIGQRENVAGLRGDLPNFGVCGQVGCPQKWTEKKVAALQGLSKRENGRWLVKFSWKGVEYRKGGFQSRDAAKLYRDARCRVLGNAAMQRFDVNPRKPILFR